MDFLEKYGPVALISGGSEGVGASYAHLLAERGLDLVLVARNAAPLEALAAELAAKYPDRKVTTIAADLTDPATPARLAEATRNMEIGLLVNNAGSNTLTKEFADNSLDYAQRLTALNATTPMALCHHFGGLMKARGKGGIILNSSAASFIGNPDLAVYSAAKSYMNRLGEALWFEMKRHGVAVLVHILGSVDTPFIARHYPQAVGIGVKPDDIAAAGIAGIKAGPILYAPGADMFAAILAPMPPGDAVNTAYEAGKMFAAAGG